MNCTFYITQDTCSDLRISFSKLKEYISFLHEQVLYMYNHGFAIKICTDIYEVWKWQGHALYEIWQNCELDNDLTAMLTTILYERSDNSEEKSENVLFGDTETSSYGLLTTSRSAKVEEQFQVYPERTSYQYSIDFINRLSLSSDDFLDACNHIMDNVFIVGNCKTTIKPIHKDFKNTILFHLNALNIHLAQERHKGLRRDQLLKRVSQLAKLPQEASLEGNPKRKKDFTFNVIDNNGKTYEICCEPHMKLCHSDRYPGDLEFYNHRIYFHEGINDVLNGKIIVGHIGYHL